MNDDDAIIQQRIAGSGVRAIAKSQCTTLAQVNEAIERRLELRTAAFI